MKKPLILGLIVLVFDQITKYLVELFMPHGTYIKIINIFDFFNITHITNTGAAFSIGYGKNILFIVMITVFLAMLGFWIYKNSSKLTNLQKYAFCLVFAGGIGNLIDRIFRGAVVDFLDFGVNALRWPSFNVADSAICVAAGLILISLFKKDQ